MNSYEEKLARRKAYYERKAAEATAESKTEYETAHKMASAIPFGQPILVGHYSERSDRAYRGRMSRHFDKSIEADKKAEYYAHKAEAVGKGGISSDDPDALEKLTGKLNLLKHYQDFMKAVNKAVRLKDTEKGDARLIALGIPAAQIPKYREPDFCGRIGFPDYELRNNNAKIKSVKNRINALERMKEQAATTQDVENDLYTFRIDENRVQFIFNGKPEPAIRNILKAHRFRWSPSRGAWVRQATLNGTYAAEAVRKELDEMEAFDNE